MSEPLEMNVDFETSDTEMNLETDMNCNIEVPLPIASATQLGGIKVGENLSIVPDGTLSAELSAVDDTLTIAGAAADAKKTGDEISGLKEDLDDVQDILFVKKKKTWKVNTSHPTGWSTGYWTKSVGETISSTNSTNYIKTYYILTEGDIGEDFDKIIFTPPTGYYLTVKAVDPNNIITAVYGGTVDYTGAEISIDHVAGTGYAVYLGRFNGDSGDYYNDAEFISNLTVHIIVKQDFITRSETNTYMIEEGESWEA